MNNSNVATYLFAQFIHRHQTTQSNYANTQNLYSARILDIKTMHPFWYFYVSFVLLISQNQVIKFKLSA